MGEILIVAGLLLMMTPGIAFVFQKDLVKRKKGFAYIAIILSVLVFYFIVLRNWI